MVQMTDFRQDRLTAGMEEVLSINSDSNSHQNVLIKTAKTPTERSLVIRCFLRKAMESTAPSVKCSCQKVRLEPDQVSGLKKMQD